MRNLLLQFDSFDSPLQFWAANINNSGYISTFDLLLAREILFGRLDIFSIDQLWSFVPADFNFPPNIPPTQSFPETIFLENLVKSAENQDFIAIKKGDVISENDVPVLSTNPKFKLADVNTCDEFVRMALTIEDFTEIIGFQFGLTWDSELLEYLGFEENDLVNSSASTKADTSKIEEGFLPFVSFEQDSMSLTLPDSTVLVTFHFKVTGEIGDQIDVKFDDVQFDAMAIGSPLGLTNPVFEDGSVSIVGDHNIAAVINLVQNVSCAGGADGAIDISATGGNPPFEFSWNNGASTEDLEMLEAGSYTVTISAPNICDLVMNVDIYEPDSLKINQLEVVHASASDASDGSIFIGEISGGVPPYEILLDGAEGGPLFQNLAPGEYSVTILDANDCVLEETVELSFETAVTGFETIGIKTALQPNIIDNHATAYLLLELPKGEELELKLFDTTSKLLQQQAVYFEKGESVFQVQAPESPGLYFLQVVTKTGHFVIFKLVVF